MQNSAGFDAKVAPQSNFRRIQRFMAGADFTMELVARLTFSLLPKKDSLVLVIDRAKRPAAPVDFGKMDINILMLNVSYKNIAFPLMFRMLDKKGNYNTLERIAIMNNFIKWFGKDCIDCLLVDRVLLERYGWDTLTAKASGITSG